MLRVARYRDLMVATLSGEHKDDARRGAEVRFRDMSAAPGQALWPRDQVFPMSRQAGAIACIRPRRATVDTARDGQVGRCSKPDHSVSARQAARAAQVESARGSDLPGVRTSRSACL